MLINTVYVNGEGYPQPFNIVQQIFKNLKNHVGLDVYNANATYASTSTRLEFMYILAKKLHQNNKVSYNSKNVLHYLEYCIFTDPLTLASKPLSGIVNNYFLLKGKVYVGIFAKLLLRVSLLPSRTDFWSEKFSTHGAPSSDRVHTRTLYSEINIWVVDTVVHCSIVRLNSNNSLILLQLRV